MLRALDGCIKCGACLAECSVLRLEGRSAFPGPRRLAVEGPHFSRELIALKDPLEMCTTCSRCESACPSRLPLTDAMTRMRSKVGPGNNEGRRRLLQNVHSLGRTIPPEGRLVAPRMGRTLFFPGCVGESRALASTQAALDLLLRVDDGLFVPDDWSCCGSPLEKVGEFNEVEKLRDANAALFEVAEEIVTSCPGCAVQLRRANDVESLHVLEYLYESVGISRLELHSHRPIKVALHSPCHLLRTVGPHAMDYAREILSAVPGVQVVDMNEDECCGGGGGVASARPELARKMSRRKVNSAVQAGAELLVAPCPFCVVNLRKVGGMRVEEFTSFLASLSSGRS